jgi:hypothetical protein
LISQIADQPHIPCNSTESAVHISGKTLQYTASQEHVLRRIGAALIIHWDELPDAVQDLVIDQAVLVGDREPIASGREEIETFIRTVKVRDFKPAAAT